MLRFLPLVLAFTAIAAVAVYDGTINYRWSTNQAAEAYAQLLDEVPDQVGDWRGTNHEINDEILRTAGAQGYVSRTYINEKTKARVDIWLIVGRYKHIIRHTPDICYPANDKPRTGKKEATYSFDIPGLENSFLTATFGKHGSNDRVFWGFLDPDSLENLRWQGLHLEQRRNQFAGTPALFKLYFTTHAASEDSTPEESAALTFAAEFLPMLTDLIREKGLAASAGQ